MRQCPSLNGDERALITHTIENGVCMQRQREFYHKCHRCQFNGKAADFVLPEPEVAPSRNGTVAHIEIEVDRELPAKEPVR